MSGALLRTKADEFLEQGIKLGMEQGWNEVSHLYCFLVQHGRIDDMMRASTDRDYLEELLSAFKNGDLSV